MKRWGRRGAVLGFAMVLATSGCAGAGGGGGGGGGGDNAISVLMVNNPQMVDLQKLTADNFTKQTGITVNYTVLPENDVRDKISQEFSSQAGQYDVASLSNFEIPIYAKNGWVAPMDDFVAKDAAFNQGDILKPMTDLAHRRADGKIYGQPFYGESSFLMYRKDVFDAKGLTDARQADLAAGGRPRGEGRRRAAQHEGHLPARPARLGPGLRSADHRRQHLRRHVVREGLDARGERAGVQGSDQLLRQPGQGARRERRPAGGLHRVPERHAAGQRRDVVRRDVRGGLARGHRLTGQGQGRVRGRAGQQDRRLRAGSTPGPGPSRRPARSRRTRGSSSPGPRARTTRSSWVEQGGLGEGARRASAPRPTPTPIT